MSLTKQQLARIAGLIEREPLESRPASDQVREFLGRVEAVARGLDTHDEQSVPVAQEVHELRELARRLRALRRTINKPGIRRGRFAELKNTADWDLLQLELEGMEEKAESQATLLAQTSKAMRSAPQEIFVTLIADSWEKAFQRRPTTTAGGLFEEVVELIYDCQFDRSLNRRRFVRGMADFRRRYHPRVQEQP